MAKISGGVRTLKTGSKEYNARKVDVDNMKNSGLYSEVYFSQKSGGYMAVEQSPFGHKPEEIRAAKILANNGYKMILKNEAGHLTTPDGKIFSYFYEQHTPSKTSFHKSLEHAKNKHEKLIRMGKPGIDVALVYVKYNRYSKKDVVEGIKKYESYQSNRHRFNQIIVVTPKGRIHRHRHNK